MKNLIKILTLVTALMLLSSCSSNNETNNNAICDSICADTCKAVDSTNVSKDSIATKDTLTK